MIGFGQINPLTGTSNSINNLKQSVPNTPVILNTSSSVNFDADCSKDFWTIRDNGYIQKWSIINNAITGGDTILTGGGSGLAFCGNSGAPTFYCGNYPNTGITYYDSLNNWVNIPTSVPVTNNAGYENNQYYLYPIPPSGALKVLKYFDGLNLITIDSLQFDYFSVFDIAVDVFGRAWVFEGTGATSVNKLNVYDNTGLITSYNITFSSGHTYGSFFLNETLYVGMGSSGNPNPNSITPILIVGSTAQLGTPISFPYLNYYDMASCQDNSLNVTYDCVENVCIDPGTGNGTYASLAACQSNCTHTALQEHTTKKELLKVTDLLGRETKGTKNEVLFYIYDDGTVEKRIVIE